MHFSLIESHERLQQVLQFLASGFGWDDSQRASIDTALSWNSEFKVTGATLDDDTGAPLIAILFFYQGLVSMGGLTRPVINLSSWYSEPSHRGLDSVIFANRVITYLHSRSCIVTDYTPSDAARSILMALGFRPQLSARIRMFFWDFYTPHRVRSLLASIAVAEDENQYATGFACTGQTMTRIFDLSGTRVCVMYTVTRVKRQHLPVKLVRIIWADSYVALAQNVKTISLKLLRAEKAVAADVYLKSMTADPSSAWLIDDTESAVSFVPPLQSELPYLQ